MTFMWEPQLGFSGSLADILQYLAVLTGHVPPCHLHLLSVPNLEAALERLYCA